MTAGQRRGASDSDDQLARRARDGDVDAVEQILRRHYGLIHGICSRIVVDRGGAEDATQESLIAVSRGLRRFDGRSALTTWIYRIATNAALDEVRRSARRPRPIDHRPTDVADPAARPARPTAGLGDRGLDRTPEEQVTENDLLDRALAALEPDFRATVALRYVADLEYAEIATVLGIPVGTVRSRLARARGVLRVALGNSEHAPSRQRDDDRRNSGR